MDLRKIMNRAWEIKRENNKNIFGLCLKMAWEETKTEKANTELYELLEDIQKRRGFSTDIEVRRNKWETKDGKYSRTYIKIFACKRMYQFYINNLNNKICRDFNANVSVSKEVKEKVGDLIKKNALYLKLA